MYTVAADLVRDEHKAMAGGILNLFGGCAMLAGNALQGIPCIMHMLSFPQCFVIKQLLIKADLSNIC